MHTALSMQNHEYCLQNNAYCINHCIINKIIRKKEQKYINRGVERCILFYSIFERGYFVLGKWLRTRQHTTKLHQFA